MQTSGYSLASMTLDAWLTIGFLGVGCSFLAVLYLGETLSVSLVLGAVLVIAGVALTERG